jgi:AcrR family transcriptional regulator
MPSKATPKATYHHGDLRDALIASGVAMLRDVAPEALSLRELAKRAGVSHNAPYRHFADREALLGAICAQGFERMNASIDDALQQTAGDPRAQFSALRAYVAFALAYPHHMQIMFGMHDLHKRPEVEAVAMRAFDQVIAVVHSGQALGLFRAGDARVIAFAIWATLHGVASILAAQRGSISGVAERDVLIDQTMAVLFNGISGNP